MTATKVYSPAEAAELYGHSPVTLTRACVAKRLKATKLRNGHWIIAEADLYAYAMKQGWSPLVDISDQIVWAPIRRRDIRFHQEAGAATPNEHWTTVCGRSTLSKTSIRVKRRDALGWGMDPCPQCFGEGQ